MMMYGNKDSNENSKKFWIVKIDKKGFECSILLYGTESGLWRYMKREFNYVPEYYAISEEQSRMVRGFGMKCYLC